MTGNAQKVYGDFTEYFEEVKKQDGEVGKRERLYVKLILTICIPIVTKAIKKLHDMDKFSREQVLKKKYRNLIFFSYYRRIFLEETNF